MDSSNGKKHAFSGMLHDRSKIIRIVNTGNLFTTINNQYGLVPVNSAVLHLNLKDEMAPKQIVVTTLGIGHDLPTMPLLLKYMELLKGAYMNTLHIQLMNTHTMDSSNGKKHAHSGMLHDRSKIIRIVNTGNLFTTIHNQSGLVPVNSAVLHLNLKDEMAPKQIVVTTLRIGHDLPTVPLLLKYMELRRYRLLPRSNLR